MKRSIFILLSLLSLLLSAIPAGAATEVEQRIALAIGNAAYPSAPLTNPVNDTTDRKKWEKYAYSIPASLNRYDVGEFGRTNAANQPDQKRLG